MSTSTNPPTLLITRQQHHYVGSEAIPEPLAMTLLALVRNDVLFTHKTIDDARLSTLINDVYRLLAFAVSQSSPRELR